MKSAKKVREKADAAASAVINKTWQRRKQIIKEEIKEEARRQEEQQRSEKAEDVTVKTKMAVRPAPARRRGFAELCWGKVECFGRKTVTIYYNEGREYDFLS